MKTIHHYYVEISDSSGIMGHKNEFKSEDIEIIGENDRYLVINDRTFTTIDKQASKYCVGQPLGRECIGISANDSVWGNRITYSLYTFERKKAATIRKKIEKEISSRFGFFASGVDLSIIQDKKTGGAA